MTVTPALIMAAIHARLEETFPGEQIYEDLAPEGFERPSNLIELAKISLDALSLGCHTVSLRYDYKLTTFCEVDQVHDSHLPTLDLRAMMIMGAFAAGYLKVADRAPKITALAADTSLYDAAEVTLALTLTVDRSEFLPEELVEIMQTLDTRFIDKKQDFTYLKPLNINAYMVSSFILTSLLACFCCRIHSGFCMASASASGLSSTTWT